ncbi:MAG TPA: PaaI family thioesterase [Anaeromyxobacter sp.]|nr:PaaI family thioesterase [Anaeromyxobacter sp.]
MPVTPATLESGSRIPLLRTLGITLTEIGERHAAMRVVVDDRHRNFFGGTHGGLIATLVDTVCFFPRPFLPSGRECTTTNLSVSYVRASSVGDVLTSRAELLHLGRRTGSLAVRVEDQGGRLVAHGTATLMFLDGAAAPDAAAGPKRPSRPAPKRRSRRAG